MKPSRLPAVVWALCVVASVISIAALAPELPERVASHFGAAAHANGWMSRAGYLAFSTVFTVGFSSFLVVLCYSFRFFPSATLNVPNPGYWRSSEHYPTACQFLLRHAFWFGALSALWAGSLNYLLVRANGFTPPRLPPGSVAALTAVYLAGTAIWVVPVVRFFRRVPSGPPPG